MHAVDCIWSHHPMLSPSGQLSALIEWENLVKFRESVSLSSICSPNYIINRNFSNNKKLDEGSDYKPIILVLSKNNGKGSKIAIRPFSWDTP